MSILLLYLLVLRNNFLFYNRMPYWKIVSWINLPNNIGRLGWLAWDHVMLSNVVIFYLCMYDINLLTAIYSCKKRRRPCIKRVGTFVIINYVFIPCEIHSLSFIGCRVINLLANQWVIWRGLQGDEQWSAERVLIGNWIPSFSFSHKGFFSNLLFASLKHWWWVGFCTKSIILLFTDRPILIHI